MKYLIILAGFFISNSLSAQVCSDFIEQNAFLARYELDADPSVVIDLATGLQWQRCAVGYEFNDNGDSTDITAHTCDTPTETSVQRVWNWNQAIERAAQEGGGWRLPNIKELTSLVEFACHTPAINTEAFPNTQQTGHWTSTPNASTDSSAWSINFADGTAAVGTEAVSTKRTSLPIRLVHD